MRCLISRGVGYGRDELRDGFPGRNDIDPFPGNPTLKER